MVKVLKIATLSSNPNLFLPFSIKHIPEYFVSIKNDLGFEKLSTQSKLTCNKWAVIEDFMHYY